MYATDIWIDRLTHRGAMFNGVEIKNHDKTKIYILLQKLC